MLNQYFYPLLITGIVQLSLALFVLFKGFRKRINQAYALYSAGIAIWAIFEAYAIIVQERSLALLLWRINHMGVIIIPIGFVHFVYCAVEANSKKRKLILISYLVAFIFMGLNCTKLLILEVVPKFSFRWFINSGSLYYLFFAIWCCWILYGLFKLFKGYFKSTGAERNKLKYFCWSMLIAYVGGVPNFFPTFNIEIPILMPFGTYAIAIYAGFTVYAMLRYRLMNITLVVTRTSIFIFVYTLILGIPFAVAANYRMGLINLLGTHWWMAPLGLMGLLATFGPYLYIYLERKAEGRLLKEQRLYQRTLKQASAGMTRIRSLRKLLNLIAHIVTSTVKISYIAVYLYDEPSNEYVLHVSRDKGRDSVVKLSADNFLVLWLIRNRDVLIYEEVKRKFQDTNFEGYRHLEEEMRLLTAAVIIPSFLEDKFMGLFVLGDKLSGQMYTTDDLNVFQVLASQAALAIENAKFYEEAKEMQEQISQAEKMATIGTMADGLSHQLNNRFYALSLIAGNTIDTIKLTDASKCTTEVKDMINEINYALGRIQANVMQGGEVVRGLLKYSRRGDVGSEALELNAVIDNTIEMVQFKVKLSEIDIVRDFGELPKIRGNMAQLEEVFFNFIDNAYDSIVERSAMLKEEGYRGRITISARQKNEEMLEIIVEDNGMGVKTDDSKKIFTPFFTTKTSSRKGTGLGLYVIKRIITDMHKGKINFESDYKIGTRFIVELPLAKESV